MEDFRLKVFRAVAERLNFTQAAESLYLTQPAVTLQIKALEEDLGLKLFDRAGGRVRLTEAGIVLLDYAQRIDALYKEAEQAVGVSVGDERGSLALGASTTIAQYVLPALVGEFAATYPRVDVSIISANTEGIVRALDDKRITLGLVEAPTSRNDLKTERFIEDEIVPIVGAQHAWASATHNAPKNETNANVVTREQLADARLIMRERGSGTRRVVETALKRAGLKLNKLNISMELDSTEAIKAAVEAGLGVGFVSRWGIVKELRLETLAIAHIKNLNMRRGFQFIYPRTPSLEGAAELFLRFARRRRPLLIKQ
jgi:DNA-binding transcriptional LysR family regulator